MGEGAISENEDAAPAVVTNPVNSRKRDRSELNSDGGEGDEVEKTKEGEEDVETSPKRRETESAAKDTRVTSVANPVTLDTVYQGPTSKDDKRQWVREILFKSFVSGLAEENQRKLMDARALSSLVCDIETAQWQHHVQQNKKPQDYNNQCRSIRSNLADIKNPEFNIRVYMGAISPEELTTMSSLDMASDAKKRERRKAQKDALEACQSDWDLRNIKRAAGQFPCGRCKSNDTTYFQMQTRSSDEPMTTYLSCLNCGHRWKF